MVTVLASTYPTIAIRTPHLEALRVAREELDEARKKEIGARLKKAREAKGITQAALGTAIGVQGGSVWRYEDGEMLLGADKLVRAAIALGVTERWIMTGEEPPPVEAVVVREDIPDSFLEWSDVLKPPGYTHEIGARMLKDQREAGYPSSAAGWGDVFLRVKRQIDREASGRDAKPNVSDLASGDALDVRDLPKKKNGRRRG